MGWIERLVNGAIRLLTGLVCRVDEEQLKRVPWHGPLIIVANHINFIETPLVFVRLRPRPVTGFAKAEWWRNAFVRRLFDMWGAIPLRRGEGDVEAFRQALKALEDGKIMVLAPEGTRSGSGRLKRGQPGVALLALHSGAPILPLGFYGYENVWQNMRRLRRTDFRVGHRPALPRAARAGACDPGAPAGDLRSGHGPDRFAVARLLPRGVCRSVACFDQPPRVSSSR